MNTKSKIMTAATALLFATTATAQEHFLDALDSFKKNNPDYIANSSMENGMDNGKEWSYKTWSFKMPNSKTKQMKDIRSAFNSDIKTAYYTMQQDATLTVWKNKNGNVIYNGDNPAAGTADKTTSSTKISYGQNNESTLVFGDDPTTNYLMMLVRDKNDSIARRAVGIEWRDNGKQIEGTVYDIYGADPRKKKNTSTISSAVKTTVLADGTTIVKSYNGENETTKIYRMGDTLDGAANEDEVKDGIDFLRKFGNLRALFIDDKTPESTYRIAIANRVLSLCTKNAKLLSSDQKAVCREGLTTMFKLDSDTYLTGILKLADKALK